MSYENYQSTRAKTPEAEAAAYFENTHTLGEFVTQYQRLMQKTVFEHQGRFANIATAHDVAFVKEANTPNSQNVDEVLLTTMKSVRTAVTPALDQVIGIVDSAIKVIPNMLDNESIIIFNRAIDQASKFGCRSESVKTILSALPRDIRSALKVVLDAVILAEVRQGRKKFSIGSDYFSTLLNSASSRQAKEAMRAMLDSSVFINVMRDASTFGVDSHSVDYSLASASTKPVRAAMKAALDIEVLRICLRDALIFGKDSTFVKGSLDHASSKKVRTVFERRVAEQKVTKESPFAGTFSPEDFLNAYFRRNSYNQSWQATSGGAQGSSSASGQGQQETYGANRHNEVQVILGRVVARNRQYGWIQNEPVENIKRIINTVRKLRANAKERGTECSDKTIYLRYRAKAETNPEFTKSVQILEALMGGDINGNLPF